MTPKGFLAACARRSPTDGAANSRWSCADFGDTLVGMPIGPRLRRDAVRPTNAFPSPVVVCLCLAMPVVAARAEDDVDFTPAPIRVPDGFVVELAAGPPLVRHPMMACFDDRGRLFIAESRGNNLEKKELLERHCRFIRMLEDTDNDGRFDRSTIFADDLVMPEGALWHRGSLYVLSSPYLWRLEDSDDDGVADVRERLVGYMEFNGKANQHGAYLGPNGRLYFSGGTFGYDLADKDGTGVVKGSAAGVFSCRPDGTDVRVFGTGGINPVEVAFTPEGEMLSTCAIFDNLGGRHDALIHWVRGATASPVDFHPPVLPQTGHRLPALRRWGKVSPSGLTRYRGATFGPSYRNAFFATQFNTGKVIRTRLERAGATFRGVDEEFMSSTSPDFRPTDVIEDADGSLLVIDTGGWFRISCPTSKIAKPKILGAIYRIRKEQAEPIADPRGRTMAWSEATSAELGDRLDDPRPAVRDRAIETLAERGDDALIGLGQAIASESPRKRRNAVWTLSRIEDADARPLIRRALTDLDATVRQAAARSCGVLVDGEAVSSLADLLSGESLPVRRAAATALGAIGDRAAVPALLSACAAGGDEHLMHSLIYALIEIGDFEGTSKGLTASNSQVRHAALVALDRIDASRLTQEQVAPLLESDDSILKQAALKIVTTRPGWSDRLIEFLEEWVGGAAQDPSASSIAAGAIVSFAHDERVQRLIARALTAPSTTANVRSALLEAIGRTRSLPDSWVEPLGRLLRSNDESTSLRTVAALAASGTKKLDDRLESMAKDDSTADSVRIAAWICLAEHGARLSPEGFAMLLGRVTAPMIPPLDRLAAAKALASAKLDRAQMATVAETLPTVGPLELPALIEVFGHTDPKDNQLGSLFRAGLAQARTASALSSSRLERLFATFPERTRREGQRLVAGSRADEGQMGARLKQVTAKLVPGDPQRGKEVFFSQRAACSACHTADGQGGAIGPVLSSIGAIRTRADLLESILFPSASIVNNFETYSVATTDGRILQGLIQRTTDRSIVLRNTQRSEVVVPRDDIDQLAISRISIMPQGLDQNLSTEQISDLLAYLSSLRSLVGDSDQAKPRGRSQSGGR